MDSYQNIHNRREIRCKQNQRVEEDEVTLNIRISIRNQKREIFLKCVNKKFQKCQPQTESDTNVAEDSRRDTEPFLSVLQNVVFFFYVSFSQEQCPK